MGLFCFYEMFVYLWIERGYFLTIFSNQVRKCGVAPCRFLKLRTMINLQQFINVVAAGLMLVGIWWLVLNHAIIFAIGIGLLFTLVIAAVIIENWNE